MIVSKIRGGLGNQLFTYAAGRCLSVIHDVPLLLDTSWYKSGPRTFWLGHFNITADITWEDQSKSADGIGYNQEHWSYYAGFQDYSGYKFLSGWWQSERFFEPIAKIIRRDLALPDGPIIDAAHAWLRQFRSGHNDPCVAMHRRRHDYVQLASQGQFTLLDDTYYHAAMARFPEPCTFLLFSDDLPWCRAHMGQPGIEFCDVEDALVSFAIMQLCDHYIIANSTFSWWAAWLGEAPGKRVIAPHSAGWFGPVLAEKYASSDIIPARWSQLPLAGV
jgi:hypothetical protein